MAQLVKGSIGAIAQQTGQSLAQTFLDVDCVVIVDTSGSMGSHDAPQGRSRYDQACWELATLQGDLPGKIAVITFSDSAEFCPNGTPRNLGGTTALDQALKFAKVADVPGMRFVVISDGIPNSESSALAIARKYQNRIDTIFVGPEGDTRGREFLQRLAAASGGQHVTAAQAKALSSSVQKLLAVA